MIVNPCRNCTEPERCINGHVDCIKYLTFQAEFKKQKAFIKKQNYESRGAFLAASRTKKLNWQRKGIR